MNLNEVIQSGRSTVTQIVTYMRDNTYFVDPSFQRRLVWTERHKARLIETILIGYPMPEIYLWQQPVDAETGQQRFSIVDGQQRLTSIVQFISNEYTLRGAHLDKDHRDFPYADQFWKDLDGELKGRIWNYVINIRTIPQNVSESQIRLIFARLNETDKSLNPQELRNARFDGEFVKAAVELADSAELKAVGVFVDKNDIRRMEDVEFASQLLIYERAGITSDTPASINRIYDNFNDSYPEKQADLDSAKQKLRDIAAIFDEYPKAKEFFSEPNDLYALYCAIDIIKERDIAFDAAGMVEFIDVYNKNDPNEDVTVARYREGSSFRTRSKGNREKRVYGLLEWISAPR